MAYVIESKQRNLSEVKSYLSNIFISLKNGDDAELVLGSEEKDFLELHRILNDIIEEGIAYPQENILNFTQFKQYYTTNEVFILKFKNSSEIIGSFYIKPNFPGRCDHFCNGGFIVDKNFRNLGAGKVMGFHYLRLANLLGYKASFFNLVFANNLPALNLWRKLGFKELSTIPNVGRGKEGGFVNAHQFYYDLSQVDFEEKLIS
jgi:GNAT superfamily N-acetyltransferase